MTVSSTISVFCRDGVFRTVYCHLHGEPTWNGRILHTHYATGQQAEALVEHGDIRCLGPRCDKPAGHTLQNPVDGVTAYYGRDSGFRMDSEAREYRSFREAIATESTEEVRFHYVFIDGYQIVLAVSFCALPSTRVNPLAQQSGLIAQAKMVSVLPPPVVAKNIIWRVRSSILSHNSLPISLTR